MNTIREFSTEEFMKLINNIIEKEESKRQSILTEISENILYINGIEICSTEDILEIAQQLHLIYLLGNSQLLNKDITVRNEKGEIMK
jgi:hypothetical protein